MDGWGKGERQKPHTQMTWCRKTSRGLRGGLDSSSAQSQLFPLASPSASFHVKTGLKVISDGSNSSPEFGGSAREHSLRKKEKHRSKAAKLPHR